MKQAVARRIIEQPAKAGVLLYETMGAGNRKFLVPYNEGRFAKNGRYLVLPKGSIDYEKDVGPGEKFDRTPIAGGIRETSEETGFPLERFLGEKNIRKLEAGKTLQHITHPDFPGFEIIEASPKAYPHVYHARAGKEQTMVIYGFKVKGLDTLIDLKNGAGKTTKQFLDENPEMPRFDTFLKWMKQGYIPASGNLPEVKLFNEPDAFQQTVDQVMSQGVEVVNEFGGTTQKIVADTIEVPGDWQATRDNWQAFCAALDKKEYAAEYKTFRTCFSQIKARLKAQGWIKGDLDVLKFDEKDCPLFYYTEGSVVEDEGKIIRKTFSDMAANPDYARAFGGTGTKLAGLSAAQTMVLGQVAAYGSFVKPSTWRSALLETMGETGKLAHGLIKHSQRIRSSASTLVQARA